MNKTLKKTLSIILTVLMIVTTVPFAFAAEEDITYYSLKLTEAKLMFDDSEVNGYYYGFKEDPESVFDNDPYTKMCLIYGGEYLFEYSGHYYYVIAETETGAELPVTQYTFTTANDSSERDPDDWKVYGSKDKLTWQLIDEVTNAEITDERLTDVDFKLETATEAYRYFKFEFTGIKDETDVFQIADIKLASEGLHTHEGGTQTCKGYKCTVCGSWYGELGAHAGATQTCEGYKCDTCGEWYGEKGDHLDYSEQTCKGYYCYDCYEWFGEADTSKHGWYYGYCDYCEIEYPVDEECTHDMDDYGECITCGYDCPHEIFENGICTTCSYTLPFSLTTGENTTYHSTFEDAVDKAEDGSVIKLLKNYADYNGVEINKAITLDLNGKTWDQPSLGQHTVTADVTFTDSVGDGACSYGFNILSPCTFEGGSYRYIWIKYETGDTLEDLLAPCCSYYSNGEVVDLSGQTSIGSGIEISANHIPGTQNCLGYKCENCGKYFGEVDADAHDWSNIDGVCANGCGATCDHNGGEATCTAKAVCETCGVEYGDIDKDNHKDTLVPVEAKAKTCTEIGWDAYEYCTACDYSTYEEIPASHEIKTVDKKDATCTEAGHEAYEYCTECDYTTYKELPSNGHTPLDATKENEVAPKCGVAGSYDLVVCCDVCGEELDRDTTTVDALTHTDADGDYLCDNGCGHEFEKPVDPTPDEPTDTDCDHLCHKSGFMGFIWKIIRFFQKLFRIQRYCDCGAAHW